jgi:hypothetical protein
MHLTIPVRHEPLYLEMTWKRNFDVACSRDRDRATWKISDVESRCECDKGDNGQSIGSHKMMMYYGIIFYQNTLLSHNILGTHILLIKITLNYTYKHPIPIHFTI